MGCTGAASFNGDPGISAERRVFWDRECFDAQKFEVYSAEFLGRVKLLGSLGYDFYTNRRRRA